MSRFADTAGAVATHAHERLARAVVIAIHENEEAGRPLNQLQQIEIVKAAIACFDGLTAEVAEALSLEYALRGIGGERS